MNLTHAKTWLASRGYELTDDAGGGYEVWRSNERLARVFDSEQLIAWVAQRAQYRTTPPPQNATQAELIAWAVTEGAAWPLNTPQFYYTYWLRHVEKRALPTAPRAKVATEPAL